jgi:hypothetical protein
MNDLMSGGLHRLWKGDLIAQLNPPRGDQAFHLLDVAGGTVVRKGDLLATVESREEAIRIAITFLQYYRETAHYKERTYDYMETHGLAAIQAVVLDEASGEPGRLRERFASARAAADRDPWLERRKPSHRNQFSELDTEAPVFGVAPMAGDGDMVVGPSDEAREAMLAGAAPAAASAASNLLAVTYTNTSEQSK